MRPPLALALAAFALVALAAGEARSQVITLDVPPAAAWSSPAMPDAGPIFPYSYYAAFPAPARQYVPYGPHDLFPFHGTPYGQPYDRYSWATLAGTASPARYFYPPVR